MIDATNVKYKVQIQSQAIVDNGYWVGSHQGTNPVNIDTAGCNYALITWELGASDIAMAELSLYESDTTTDGDFAIIAASNYATAGIGTLPSATADNTFLGWIVTNLGTTRLRYLRVNAKAGNGSTGSFLSAFALLGHPEQGIDSVSEAGFGQLVTV